MSQLGVKKVTAEVKDPGHNYERRFELDDLASLSSLPLLSELDIGDWPWFDPGELVANTSRFLGVKSLRVQGDGADAERVSELVNLCPQLEHLDLETTYNQGIEFHKLAPRLPVTLHSLRVEASNADECFHDLALPRFSYLRTLDLGDQTYTSKVHSLLVQLPLLVHLRLGLGIIDPVGFLSLLAGPSRLERLKILTRDTVEEARYLQGRRSPSPSSPNFLSSSYDSNMSDWTEPDVYLADPAAFRRLLTEASSAGVQIAGTSVEALTVLESYYGEANNRAVIDAFHRHDFEFLRLVRIGAIYSGVSLPSFDLDSLDLENLEIVENSLPEEDSFELSLRNKTAKSVQGTGREVSE
jgi:hypothetical protein